MLGKAKKTGNVDSSVSASFERAVQSVSTCVPAGELQPYVLSDQGTLSGDVKFPPNDPRL
jgi:hypothetical protein